MPVTLEFRRRLMDKYQEALDVSNRNAPRGGAIPVGGGDWMDYFFRSEAIMGVVESLRRKNGSLKDAMEDGKKRAEEAVKIWNSRREFQVHRSTCWIEDYLRGVFRLINLSLRTPCQSR